MKNNYRLVFVFLIAIIFVASTFISLDNVLVKKSQREKIRSTSSPHASVEMKRGRWDYFHTLLRDPATGEIPAYIRQRELEYAKKLDKANLSLNKQQAGLNWNEAGPHDVGGRTRALAVDKNNSNIILAGGASGGIWKSTDKGSTWIMKSTTSAILSVTSIAQDPRPSFTNNWYYASGEYSGSGNDLGFTARFTGDGVYKSTDNGETWNVLPSTLSQNNANWDSDFDFVLKVIVSPTDGNIFLAANGIGIFRSADGGNTFSLVLGGVNEHVYSDVDVASNGNVIAVLSAPFQGATANNTPGVYKSVNSGANWTKITTNGYPVTSGRSVITFAPSNPNTAYMLTNTNAQANNREDIRFLKIDFSNGTSVDRSANLPDYSSMGGVAQNNGFLTTQGSYDMALAVKPNDENYVMIGGTCLFRSTDGFATKPTSNKTAWIGGYHPVSFQYPNFHSDVHSFAFDPADPNKMWWGHDGGLSYTDDIRNTSYTDYFPWDKKNNGYNVTQFYHVSISSKAGDNRIMGGTQDNGSPFFRYTGSAGVSEDVSSGDGSYSYMGENYAFTSSQNGVVNRIKYDAQGNASFNNGWSTISPTGAANQGFINPFCVDPNNENIMYYPAGNVIWRNNQLGSIPDFENGTSVGWTKLDNFNVPSGYSISAISVSGSPSGVLYYGASNYQDVPKIYKVTNAQTATSGAIEITITGAAPGAYLHNIAINPDDANEIIAVLSNYNIVGLYHSTNGGQSFTPIEGNLEGTQATPGPSLRAATILPSGNSKNYYVATSVGLYSTSVLNGNSTVWTLEGPSKMGNVIIDFVTSRKSDGTVVAGTHGRGAFIAKESGGGAALLEVSTSQLNLEVKPGTSRAKEFTLSNPGGALLNYNISVTSNVPGSANNKRVIYPGNSFKPGINFGLTKTSDISVYAPVAGNDSLYIDDGNAAPDDFIGYPGQLFYWLSTFRVESGFSLEKTKFYMRTESQSLNIVQITVAQIKNNNITTALYDQLVNLETSSTGKWYEHQFGQAMNFNTGDTIAVIIGCQNSFLNYPAGFDVNGSKPLNSYYYDPFSGTYISLSQANTSWANSAWLVRIFGTGASVVNQSPTAVAVVSPNPADINQQVTFNGSGSNDPDGQISAYSWSFGDGGTSSQASVTHAYTQAGQYNYSLTVTDNKGATGNTSGTITIASNTPSRWTITPASGTIPAGGSEKISIVFNAEGMAEGSYSGQISVTSNGGNSIIPITITVSNTVDIKENPGVTLSYRLDQNFPNPFNPTSTIRWGLAQGNHVSIKLYDIRGAEIATLVDEYRDAGYYETIIDANMIRQKRNLASGVYIYKLMSGSFTESKKLVLLK